jgi:hypothetical protein
MMGDSDKPLFDLDSMLFDILEDEKVDRSARRLLTRDDISKLIEEKRRLRREPSRRRSENHEEPSFS